MDQPGSDLDLKLRGSLVRFRRVAISYARQRIFIQPQTAIPNGIDSGIRRTMRYEKHIAIVLCATGATVASILLVGWFWFGWGDTNANKAVLDSLPLPPGVQRLQEYPHSIAEDEGFLTPPDGWAILRTYQTPPGTTEDDILDFYISRLSQEWRWCLRHVPTLNLETGEQGVILGSVDFTKGAALVSIVTRNLNDRGGHTFSIYVEHERRYDPCTDESPYKNSVREDGNAVRFGARSACRFRIG